MINFDITLQKGARLAEKRLEGDLRLFCPSGQILGVLADSQGVLPGMGEPDSAKFRLDFLGPCVVKLSYDFRVYHNRYALSVAVYRLHSGD